IGFYNGLQRLAYTSVIGFGVLEVASGLALYKPVQLWWLVALLGGYDVARVVHMGGLLLFAGFTVTHLVLVALHPGTIAAMITGKARPHE
ncbi:MAG: cytochrome b/b6 domain-containing protein, partial [Candidatus Binatia bacterium]